VAGGTFNRTYTNSGSGPSGEADPATVSGFRLDKYLVTVGRFRSFVNAWNNGSGFLPAAGSGKHTHLNSGKGLANSASSGTYETGWVTADNANIAPTAANLGSCSIGSTWTATAGTQENLPISCVVWPEAYAFCIWDGGFMPSESELEYAQAGGALEREYPWGSADPGMASEYAIYDCYYPTGSGSTSSCTGTVNVAPVGTPPLGAGLWGQLDLEGDGWVYTMDWFATFVDPCVDCSYLAQFSSGLGRVFKGGGWASDSSHLLPTDRQPDDPPTRNAIGIRCARIP
jgi:sulfatase modifying factor 1